MLGLRPSRDVSSHSIRSRALSGVAGVVVGAFTLLDMFFGPLVRPVSQWIAASSPVDFVRQWSRRLPAYVALIALMVPLAVAEPAKIFALYLIGEGHYFSGLATLAIAYLVSIVLIDSIYEGARPQLRSIQWFAALVDRVSAIRFAITTAVKESRAWRTAQAVAKKVRLRLRRLTKQTSP